jgi:NitT/TauT family transport system permease protein
MRIAKTAIHPLIPFVSITALSEWMVKSGIVSSFLIPTPSSVVRAILDGGPDFWKAFLETAIGSGLGLLTSIVSGMSFAFLMTLSTRARLMFYPYAVFFQTVPIIAIAPLLVIWFGYGLPTVVAASFIVSVFPVIANSSAGLLGTDRLLLKLFKMMDASPRQVLFQLRLRAALPQILEGVRIAGGLAVIGAIVGEFISGTGLGGLVDSARNQQRVDRVFGAVLLASLLGILYFSAIAIVTRMLIRNQKGVEL